MNCLEVYCTGCGGGYRGLDYYSSGREHCPRTASRSINYCVSRSNLTPPSRVTFAKVRLAGLEGACCVDIPASAGDWIESAFGTEPAGLSAISLTSRVVRTSERAAPRDCTRIVAGPWKWRKSWWTSSVCSGLSLY